MPALQRLGAAGAGAGGVTPAGGSGAAGRGGTGPGCDSGFGSGRGIARVGASAVAGSSFSPNTSSMLVTASHVRRYASSALIPWAT